MIFVFLELYKIPSMHLSRSSEEWRMIHCLITVVFLVLP